MVIAGAVKGGCCRVMHSNLRSGCFVFWSPGGSLPHAMLPRLTKHTRVGSTCCFPCKADLAIIKESEIDAKRDHGGRDIIITITFEQLIDKACLFDCFPPLLPARAALKLIRALLDMSNVTCDTVKHLCQNLHNLHHENF